MNKFEFKNLTPFKWFILENFPFIEADFDALTEWQLFCKVGKQMNKIIDSQNIVGSEMEKLSQAFINLKNYVDNYFTDLNVQEQINNKLNIMAEDGTLAEIINQEIFTDLNNQVEQNTNDITSLLGYKMYVNVVAEGIANDGTDVTTELQNLINLHPNGATFYFKNGEYYFKNINLPSNTKILGDTNTKFTIETNEDVNCLFSINDAENLEFENLYMQNASNVDVGELFGVAPPSLGALKSCIYLENCNNITMKNLKLDTYFDGLKFMNTNNVTIKDCYFKDSGYSSIMVFDDSQNYVIDNCIFDTAINNNGTDNTYMIALTGDGYQTSVYVPTNIKINNCKFYNNSWEAIDTHGANEITVTNCYFENTRVAIGLYNDPRFVNRHLHMHDIIIENNVIKGVSGENGRIDVFGDSSLGDDNEGFMCKNVTIKNNSFIDCHTQNQYLIYLGYCQNFDVENNSFDTEKLCLRLRRCLFGNVNSNKFSYKINSFCVEIDGAQQTYFENNTFINTVLTPDYNIYGGASSTGESSVYFLNNKGHFSNQFIRNPGSAITWSTQGIPYINTDYMTPYKGHFTTKGTRQRRVVNLNITVSGNANSNILNTNKSAIAFIPVGAVINIRGGGTGGNDLTDVIVTEYISASQIKIDKVLETSVNNSIPYTSPFTWVED